jgi:hypothetical protein
MNEYYSSLSVLIIILSHNTQHHRQYGSVIVTLIFIRKMIFSFVSMFDFHLLFLPFLFLIVIAVFFCRTYLSLRFSVFKKFLPTPTYNISVD